MATVGHVWPEIKDREDLKRERKRGGRQSRRGGVQRK